MAKIRKINVSEIVGSNPPGNGNAVMPAGTIVVYEDTDNGITEYLLRVHDGVTDGGVPFANAPSIEHNNDINITVDSGDSSSYTWNFGQTGVLTAPGTAIFNGTAGIVVDNLNAGIAGLFNNGDVYITGGGSVRFTGIDESEGFSTSVLRFWNGEGRHSSGNDPTELATLGVGNDAAPGAPTEGFLTIVTEKETGSDKTWKFDADGVLHLPTSGDIVDSEGNSVLGGGGVNNNIWVQTFETATPATDVPQVVTSVEYDSDGNIIALFIHTNPVNDSTYYSVGKYTTTGTRIWTTRFADDFFTDGWGLAVDNDGGFVYIAGRTSADGGQDNATLTKISGVTGLVEWSKKYDFGYNSSSAVVDVNAEGDPVMVGYASNGDDRYVTTTKVDQTDGSIIWSRALDGQNDEEAYGMAVGPSGEVVAVGYMTTFGVQDAAETLSVDPVSDPQWTTSGSISADGVTADFTFTDGIPTFTNVVDTVGRRTADDVIVTVLGSTIGGVNGVDDMIVKVATVAVNDTDDRMLVVKYAANGDIVWQKAIQFDADFDCSGADADIDSEGNIYVCGQYSADNVGPIGQLMSIVKFNSSGVKQWSRRVVGNCGQWTSSIVVGADDHLYLSATTFTGTDPGDLDIHLVLAKYEFDGTVAWQRLLDYTPGYSFGAFFFGAEVGGSNLAVKQDYVAVGLGFGSEEIFGPGSINAAVAQIPASGNVFTVGNWDFKAASFSGTVNSTASDITVVNAGKTDYDNIANISTTAVTLEEDSSNFLIGTLYTAPGGDNSLFNGAYSVTLENDGTLTLPAGGTITEGYVTSNPTIQLTPASPDVASQKLVIKGGALYNFTDNGISINYSNNTALVGDTLTFYISSNTYADQTLYWWIYPEGANISDPGSGTVVLDGSSGTISFELDSDDNEFTIRVSPEDNNYGPGVIGVETGLINADAPTFDVDYHLHLTTGNLAETSIILGTDNHNVRTTTDGGISMTTTRGTVLFGNTPDNPITGSSHFHIMKADADNVDLFFGDDYNYVKLPSTQGVEIGANGPLWTFGTDGSLTVPGDIKSETGINIDINLSDSTLRRWSFGEDGVITLPNSMTIDGSGTGGQTVIIGGDNTRITIDNNGAPPGFSVTTNALMSGPTGTAHTWRFGPDGELTFPNDKIKAPVSSNISIETEVPISDPPTTIVISGADFTAVNLTYIKDGANSIWYPAGYNPATDPYIEFGMGFGIFVPGFDQALYVNTGSLNEPLAQWNTNPPLGSVAPTGVYTYPNTYVHAWEFGDDGSLTFPDATVQTTALVQGEQVFTLDTGAIDYAPTVVDFNLLFVTPAIGYSGTDPTSVTLPNGVPGQRLVIFNGYNLATLTVNPGPVGRDISSGVVAEFIYSGFDGLWIPLYGTNSPT